jgi:hypothetical protein
VPKRFHLSTEHKEFWVDCQIATLMQLNKLGCNMLTLSVLDHI